MRTDLILPPAVVEWTNQQHATLVTPARAHDVQSGGMRKGERILLGMLALLAVGAMLLAMFGMAP